MAMVSAKMRFEFAGWGIIRGFLASTELITLAPLVDEALSLPRHQGMSRPGNDLVPLRWSSRVVACILGCERRLRRLRNLLQPEDLKWLSGYVSTKEPRSPALSWHQDWWCWDRPISFRHPTPQVAVLCYLHDTDVSNGALRVLPGSHHRSTTLHPLLPEPHSETANQLSFDHPAMIDCPGQITLAVRAGDAVVLDYRLLHGTHANATHSRRDCVLLSFIPNWDALPPALKAHLIVHPALPNESEGDSRKAGGYAELMPSFSGAPMSLLINRTPPPAFTAQ